MFYKLLLSQGGSFFSFPVLSLSNFWLKMNTLTAFSKKIFFFTDKRKKNVKLHSHSHVDVMRLRKDEFKKKSSEIKNSLDLRTALRVNERSFLLQRSL